MMVGKNDQEMTNKRRLLVAAAFQEPDRVPIELRINKKAYALPECQKIVEFINTEADNFISIASGADWGFWGITSKYHEIIENDLPGEYRIIKRIHTTAVGDFTAITQHYYPHLDNPDFYWIKRYIATLDDLDRLIAAPRTTRPVLADKYYEGVEKVGEKGVPIVSRLHPLGNLVRNATMEEVYGWIALEPKKIHKFLEITNSQVIETIRAMGSAGMKPWFITHAHEMFIPPWLGRRQFDEFVFPYDKKVNDEIHRIGGYVRAHCHGNARRFLERMSEMGTDSIEPLEPLPYGDVDLAEAKRLVGDCMLLSGNIPSQAFTRMSRDEVKESVRMAIKAAAGGGGFTLKTTGEAAGVNPYLDPAMLRKIIENVEAYIEAGMEYGQYR